MTEWLADAPLPQQSISLGDLASLPAGETPLGEFLGASMAEGFWTTGAGQAQAQARRLDAARAGEARGQQPLTQDAWRTSPHFREGLTWREGMTESTARVEAEIADEIRARRALIGGRNAGVLDTVLGFGAGLVGSIPTPENFIPFAGPAIRAAEAGRFGAMLARAATEAQAMRAAGLGGRVAVGAGTGALDATLGNLAVMPLTIPSRESFGDDVTFADVMLDLAFGLGAGGLIGGAAGLLPGPAPMAAAPEAPGRPAAPADTAARLAGISAAADQLLRNGQLDLATMPAPLRAELERAQTELARMHAAMGKSAAVANRSIAGGGEARPGGTGTATTPTGQSVPVAYEVVELASLVPSHRGDFTPDPRFPADLQPRDRSAREYQAQVARIASELRPEEVAASPLATTGAPIVRPDGAVLSGNGRVLAIQRAYAEGLPTAEAYRAYLAAQGFDVAGMQQPVLVRRTPQMEAAAERRFTRDANSDQVAQKTTAEIARTDAERLTPDVLALIRGPDLASAGNAGFIRAFTDAMPQAERTGLSRDGALTPDGMARINRALAARAYGDADAIALLTERLDSQVDTIGRALLDAAPTIARLRGAIEAGRANPDLDPSAAIVAAVRRINDARQGNLPLADMLDHPDMLGGGPGAAERAWLDLLLRRPDSDRLGGLPRDQVAERVKDYGDRALAAPADPDMLGNPPPGFAQIMAETLRAAGLAPRADLSTARGGAAADSTPPNFLAPPEPQHTPLPPPTAPAGDEAARLAAEAGFDMDPGPELEAARLLDLDELPQDIRTALDQADELAGKVQRAPETWQAAAACAIRG